MVVGRSHQKLSAAVEARAMLGRTPPMQGTFALPAELSLKICRKFPSIHLGRRTIQKVSADLADYDMRKPSAIPLI